MSPVALIVGLVAGWWAGRRSRSRCGAAAANGASASPGRSEFDFLSLMSHELNTPVNVLIGYLQLLENDIPDPLPASAREHIRQARLATLRMSDLVDDLLAWTRIESGREHLHPERVAAADIVESACRSLRDQAGARGIALETDAPPDIVLRTDHTKACHALRALVANGLKFTDTGSVRVTVEQSGDRTRFRVRDTGIGIPAEHHHDIFQPYWQREATIRRTRGGVGIGLTVARQLARGLDGDVTVQSVPGEGSEFVLELPGADRSAT